VHVIERVVKVGFDAEDVNLILRSRCTLGILVRLNGTLDNLHKDAITGTVLSATLEYSELAMNWHWTLALVKC